MLWSQKNGCLEVKQNRQSDKKISSITLRDYSIPINRDSVSVETNLRSWRRSLRRSLSYQGWGGVLYVPVKELRVENPPKSNRSCQFLFKEKKEDKESRLTNSVGQIIQSMNELLGERYEEKKENVKAAGKSKSEA